MFKKVLIANRGEIAIAIARTAKRLGIATVAVYSDADAKALHVSKADESVHVGPSPAGESYLRIDKIMSAAKNTGADCLHPGYGFLAENADLADACANAGITFIGPSPEAMRKMGSKTAAKAVAAALGVPVVPGYDGAKQSAKGLASEAKQIGFPVMIKAVHGGGGRGMRLVEGEADFAAALDSAVREAAAAFGDGRVLLEKVIERPRHIEVQVFGDTHGNVVHMFERDCSLQRRHQKVIEEAPAPGMSEALRDKMTVAAIKIAKAVNYEGAGTVEFLVEGGALTRDAPWYFIEMNTRLQVEHPVTEEVTGLDLVEWQFRVAAGEKLPAAQKDIKLDGHAIEARLCAEDPSNSFMPCTGRIAEFAAPEDDGLRVETGVDDGSEISPFYDSLIGKLIGHGKDREAAARILISGIDATSLFGLKTNARFLIELARRSQMPDVAIDTGLIGRELASLTGGGVTKRMLRLGAQRLIMSRGGALSSAATEKRRARPSPWDETDGFQLGGARRLVQTILVDGHNTDVEVLWHEGGGSVRFDVIGLAEMPQTGPGSARVRRDGDHVYVLCDNVHLAFAWPRYDADAAAENYDGGSIKAPINGRIVKLAVHDGETVAKGQMIAVIEAMKMEHVLSATRAGTVTGIAVSQGDSVSQGMAIAAIVPDGEQ